MDASFTTALSPTCIIIIHSHIYQPLICIRKVFNWYRRYSSWLKRDATYHLCWHWQEAIGQSSLASGYLNSASSCSSAAGSLHSILWVAQCFLWHVALQYLTSIHDLHLLRLTPTPLTPQLAQQAAGADLVESFSIK